MASTILVMRHSFLFAFRSRCSRDFDLGFAWLLFASLTEFRTFVACSRILFSDLPQQKRLFLGSNVLGVKVNDIQDGSRVTSQDSGSLNPNPIPDLLVPKHTFSYYCDKWSSASIKRWGKREIPEKTRQPAASPSTIPTCENLGMSRPGIEPGTPWWEISRLTARPPQPRFLERPALSIKLFSELSQESIYSPCQIVKQMLMLWPPTTRVLASIPSPSGQDIFDDEDSPVRILQTLQLCENLFGVHRPSLKRESKAPVTSCTIAASTPTQGSRDGPTSPSNGLTCGQKSSSDVGIRRLVARSQRDRSTPPLSVWRVPVDGDHGDGEQRHAHVAVAHEGHERAESRTVHPRAVHELRRGERHHHDAEDEVRHAQAATTHNARAVENPCPSGMSGNIRPEAILFALSPAWDGQWIHYCPHRYRRLRMETSKKSCIQATVFRRVVLQKLNRQDHFSGQWIVRISTCSGKDQIYFRYNFSISSRKRRTRYERKKIFTPSVTAGYGRVIGSRTLQNYPERKAPSVSDTSSLPLSWPLISCRFPEFVLRTVEPTSRRKLRGRFFRRDKKKTTDLWRNRLVRARLQCRRFWVRIPGKAWVLKLRHKLVCKSPPAKPSDITPGSGAPLAESQSVALLKYSKRVRRSQATHVSPGVSRLPIIACRPPTLDAEDQHSTCTLAGGATVAERLARSPPTKANRVQSSAGSPDFRKWG
ncbi:hypothetical protein PR048_000687 [Dryococelus australis]|uniref:Uncharacterized protein n=1 Tax=Dryococelus australis TaxID=614101 RepID=A0ABQ9IFB3_9NEOP|nr:hypothetical protein PR048_000687 [Dryococelus australis]